MSPKGKKGKSAAADRAIAETICQYFIDCLMEEGGMVRVEDVISSLASVVAERCIEAAGVLDIRDHDLVPGERVFSSEMNVLLVGAVEADDIAAVPSDSVFGMLRDELVPDVYRAEDFPPLIEIFEGFAAKIGDERDWGRVRLSVPDDNQPDVLPLQVAFETRDQVDDIAAAAGDDAKRMVSITVLALAHALREIHGAIDPKLALRIALETVHGMAKTAPMTEKAMAEAGKR